MRFFLFLFLFLLTSCASKYMLPTNNFITPESQGGVLKGSFEFHQTKGTQVTIDPQGGRGDRGVDYEAMKRMGFLFSASLFEKLDIFWSHTGGGPSMMGGKFQFLGEAREARAAGHKGSIALAIGGNEGEDDYKVMDFEIQGKEALGLYGYRINEFFLPYASIGYSSYSFEGTFHKGALAGANPKYDTNVFNLGLGIELSYDIVFFKFEYTYQQLKSDKTDPWTQMVSGFSVGLSW